MSEKISLDSSVANYFLTDFWMKLFSRQDVMSLF